MTDDRSAVRAGLSWDEVNEHVRWGWVMIFVFVVLGVALEAMHAFKVGIYLDADQATRRLMWRLAHAHGTLLGVLNLVLASTAPRLRFGPRAGRVASLSLRVATLLMPAGFFLGGLWLHGGDPGLGVLLVPLGGVLLVVAMALCARAAW
jgi:hypothetical protein